MDNIPGLDNPTAEPTSEDYHEAVKTRDARLFRRLVGIAATALRISHGDARMAIIRFIIRLERKKS